MRKPLGVMVGFALLASAAGGQPAPHPVLEPAPRLAVVIVVDGLSWDRLISWRVWFTSGLKRLLDEGSVQTECRYAHVNTETGPGHASLATGTPPRVHGIALNQWYAPAPGATGMVKVYSAAQPLSGEPENSEKTIPGPGRLRVPTLGDRLVAIHPASRVVAISGKDRSAILLAGRDRRHAAYWYSIADGTFVTSAAYDATSPAGAAAAAVVARFNAEKAGAKITDLYGTTWTRMPVPDPAPEPGFESGLAAYQDPVVGPAFPHELTNLSRPFLASIERTPLADRLLTDLALDLLSDDALALGRDDAPDLLQISFSANDQVSHYYGPESVEDLETLRALDAQIGRLLDDLAQRFGKSGVVVALSADHGFPATPEAAVRRDPKSGVIRVADYKIASELNEALNAELTRAADAPPLVYRVEGCSLWLDRVALAAKGAPSERRVLAIVRRELATTWKDAVLQTFTVHRAFPGRRSDEVVQAAWNGRVPGRSGDLLIVPRYGVLVDPYNGKGSCHGTPWDYDAHVPMILWGGGLPSRLVSKPSTPYDLAPTLASWLGISLPDATGKRLKSGTVGE